MRDERITILASNIRAERNRKNLSQAELAELVQLNTNSIAQIEQARQTPSAFTLFDISRALNISVDELFKGL